jgi:hypothetical protein
MILTTGVSENKLDEVKQTVRGIITLGLAGEQMVVPLIQTVPAKVYRDHVTALLKATNRKSVPRSAGK